MKRTCLLFFSLLVFAGLTARAQTFRSAGDDVARTGFGGAVAAGDGLVFVGEPMNSSTPGVVYLFHQDAQGAWTELARLQASDGTEGDRFGAALAVDGDRLLVGAPNQSGGAGAAYLFERDAEGTWREVARLAAEDGGEADRFGGAVALDGDRALVGAQGHQENAGAVYAYHRANGAWTLHTKLTADVPGARFGAALALDGDQALVGAPRQEGNLGAVHTFRLADGTWTATGLLPTDGLEGDARFGSSLSLADGRALVGAPRYQRFVGAALEYGYDAETGTWEQVSLLVPFDAAPQTRFGTALDLNGDEAWIGAPGAARFAGAVYLFVRDPEAGGWGRVVKLTGDDGRSGDFFAGSLDARGDLAVVGIVGDDGGEGTAAIFARDAQGTWTQQAVIFSEAIGFESITGGQVPCAEGTAAAFDCENVDLVSFLSVKDIGGGRGVRTNDLWGWTDPDTGKEYALVGRTDGTAFVDISNPLNPVFLGDLPLHEGARPAAWRDVKVYKNHAYIVSDGAGPHGMQVFDLTRLRNVENPPVTFTEDAHYDKINSAHNIVINEETGFAYAVGASMGGETCGGGLHMIDIREPKNPQFAGCFGHEGTGRQGTGYTHDAQCVIYHGPDAEHQGKEICFGANETALSIADVTDKTNPKALSQASYPNVGYTHQGWLTEDQRYFFLDDELDELQNKVEGTRTLIWDVSDLDDPQLVREYVSTNRASDHNLYIKGNLMYQSNYVSGLRVFDVSDPENPQPVGYFDTVPYGEDAPGFNGSWSNYPYFKSGVIVVTSGREGVFVLKKKEVDI